jgi:hypothetical protein
VSLKSEKSADLAKILAEMGEPVVWNGQTIQGLISAPITAQELDIGGIVESADFTIKVARSAFTAQRPSHGDRIEFDGREFRIVRIGDHPGYPLLILYVTTPDE